MASLSYNQAMGDYAAPSVSIFSDRTLTTKKANSTIFTEEKHSWKNLIIFLLCLLLATLTGALLYFVSQPNCQASTFMRLTADHDSEIRSLRTLLTRELQNSTKLANEVSELKKVLKDIQDTASMFDNRTVGTTTQ